MSHPLQPAWRRQDGRIHLTYDLPHRVHSSRCYPIKAPNGSSVVVYGHDRGLTILWRGGRPLKHRAPTPRPAEQRNVTREQDDSIMIIDSDDDEPARDAGKHQQEQQQGSELDSEEDEHDPAQPYEPIVACRHVMLDAGVLRLDVPPLPPDTAERSRRSVPAILGRRLVVAVACSDGSVRIVSIPLKITSAEESTAFNSANENPVVQGDAETFILTRGESATRGARGVAITYTGQELHANTGTDLDIRPGRAGSAATGTVWDLVVASHSSEKLPILTVSCIRLQPSADGLTFADVAPEAPITCHLSSAATSIMFSPTRFSDHRHTQLLVSDSKGSVRIFEPFPEHRQRIRTTVGSHPASGQWLATLHPPFNHAEASSLVPRRCRVLDAKWALRGSAVVVLLDDGQWGVWDLEGTAPRGRSSAKGSAGSTVTSTGVSGGGITRFTLRGFVGKKQDSGLAPPDLSATSASTKDSKRLAPMTPNTRKQRQESLFSTPMRGLNTRNLAKGGISIASHAGPDSSRIPDESVIMWYGSDVFEIPSLTAYWQRAANSARPSSSGEGPVATVEGPSISQLPGGLTLGEMMTSIDQVPHDMGTRTNLASRVQHDILIVGEHRLVFLCRETAARKSSEELRSLFQAPETSAMDLDSTARVDQDMLARGDLDLGGVDRLLDGLSSGGSKLLLGSGLGGGERPRRVGFARDY